MCEPLSEERQFTSQVNPDPLEYTFSANICIFKAFFAVKIDIQSNCDMKNSYI